jgi:hypothetical protein
VEKIQFGERGGSIGNSSAGRESSLLGEATAINPHDSLQRSRVADCIMKRPPYEAGGENGILRPHGSGRIAVGVRARPYRGRVFGDHTIGRFL